KQRLALPTTAIEIARFTMLFQLRHVAPDGAPSADLPQIIFATATAIISAIPLEPAARVFGLNPTFAAPFRQRLRCVHAKIIQRRARAIWRKFHAFEPARWKFLSAIGHIFSAEHAEVEHLFRRQIRLESWSESATHRLCAEI